MQQIASQTYFEYKAGEYKAGAEEQEVWIWWPKEAIEVEHEGKRQPGPHSILQVRKERKLKGRDTGSTALAPCQGKN